MTVTFENPLDGSEFYFEKEVFFDDRAEIKEVILEAEAILKKYTLNFVRFRFRGSLYLVAKEKEKEGGNENSI